MLSARAWQPAGIDGRNRAAFSRLADTGRRDEAWWARADPVHLAPVRDLLRLLSGGARLTSSARRKLQ
jgi:hypothetical protein